MTRSRLLACALLAAAACGDSNGSTDGGVDIADARVDALNTSNMSTGTVGGAAFTAMDGIAKNAMPTAFFFTGTVQAMLISEYTGSCQKQASNEGVKNGRVMLVGLANLVAAGGDAGSTYSSNTPKGDYNIVTAKPTAPGLYAQVIYQKYDAACAVGTSLTATAGKISVTTVSTQGYAGTYDLTFGAEHVTGTFGTINCSDYVPDRVPGNCQ